MAGFSDLHQEQQERRYLEALEKAADHCRENHSEWLPIETAPKDGSRVLILLDARPPYERAEYPNCPRYMQDIGRFLMGDWAYNLMVSSSPTHWMPLPPPPQP
jgi:hypothetical protein